MFRATIAIFLLSFAPASLRGDDHSLYTGIADNEDDLVVIEFPCGPNLVCTLSRVIVQRPCYDGPRGYTALLLLSRLDPGPGIPEEEFVVFVKDQIRLLGVDPSTQRVLCYRTDQLGASDIIENLIRPLERSRKKSGFWPPPARVILN